MKRFAALAALLVLVLSLTACGAAADKGAIVSGDDGDTLETLCGADYQAYITETITMQMGNRMEYKNKNSKLYKAVGTIAGMMIVIILV